jgi:hypothetical protein
MEREYQITYNTAMETLCQISCLFVCRDPKTQRYNPLSTISSLSFIALVEERARSIQLIGVGALRFQEYC